VALTRQKLGWKYPPFEIPKEIYRAWDAREDGEKPSTPGTKNLPPTKKRIRSWPPSFPAA
jgi:transketolase